MKQVKNTKSYMVTSAITHHRQFYNNESKMCNKRESMILRMLLIRTFPVLNITYHLKDLRICLLSKILNV
jgi:hypothetical protein